MRSREIHKNETRGIHEICKSSFDSVLVITRLLTRQIRALGAEQLNNLKSIWLSSRNQRSFQVLKGSNGDLQSSVVKCFQRIWGWIEVNIAGLYDRNHNRFMICCWTAGTPAKFSKHFIPLANGENKQCKSPQNEICSNSSYNASPEQFWNTPITPKTSHMLLKRNDTIENRYLRYIYSSHHFSLKNMYMSLWVNVVPFVFLSFLCHLQLWQRTANNPYLMLFGLGGGFTGGVTTWLAWRSCCYWVGLQCFTFISPISVPIHHCPSPSASVLPYHVTKQLHTRTGIVGLLSWLRF